MQKNVNAFPFGSHSNQSSAWYHILLAFVVKDLEFIAYVKFHRCRPCGFDGEEFFKAFPLVSWQQTSSKETYFIINSGRRP